MAISLNNFMQKNIVSIQFSEEQLNRLKYEEEQELLNAYKKLGKGAPNKPDNGLESDFDIDSELGLNEESEGMEEIENFENGGGEDAGGSEIE